MILPTSTTPEVSVQTPQGRSDRPAPKGSAEPKAQAPAAKVTLSAHAEAMAREARADKAQRAQNKHPETGTRSSDPKTQQVLWSKTLWKSNPSGVALEKKPYKAPKPRPTPPPPTTKAPLTKTSAAAPREDVRQAREGKRSESGRPTMNRQKLRAYQATQGKSEASETRGMSTKSSSTRLEEVGVKRQRTTKMTGPVHLSKARGASRGARL